MGRLLNVAVCLVVLVGTTIAQSPPKQFTQADLATALSENDDLRQQLRAKNTLSTFGLSIGFGIVVATIFAIAIYRKFLTPKTKRGKQAAVLLVVAAWTSVCFIAQLNDHELMRHPVNAGMTALFFASPAILFGGIGFWWFWPWERHGKVERLW